MIHALTASLQRFWRARSFSITVTLLLLMFIVALYWKQMFITIGPGEAGVLWLRFAGGVQQKTVKGEGLHVILPWNRIYIYDLRVQEYRRDIAFLDRSGLVIDVEISIRYRAIKEMLPSLHQQIGPEYARKVIDAELISALRTTLGAMEYQEIFRVREDAFLREISLNLSNTLRTNHLYMENVLLLDLSLPEPVAAAIQQKRVYEQELEGYTYRLRTEEKEKERKQLEGEGVARFEQAADISILKWEGIKATREIAQSANTKVVIIGNDASSLPVILGNDGPRRP